ncbi:MAG TPA: hypothetical protein VKT76_17905 [Bradyrhizobium sp.]|nr:hypothetical protein [Bradyrhizobium sp.]
MTRYKPTRPALTNATVTMVNGTFLLPLNWEKVAGQTWSTRPYCRPEKALQNKQAFEKNHIFELARLSL